MASKEPEEANSHKPFKYDVFLVHSTLNEKIARHINDGLAKQGLRTYAHCKEGSEFGIGKPIVEGIKDAVEKSRIVLVLMTPEAIESSWVTLELLLSFEKSVASGEMCIRLAVYDLTDEQLKVWKDLESIPKIRIDFNRDCWAARLANNIKAKVEMTDILPAGNVALGLVYNYFAGFLNHILPVLKSKVENSTYYKENKNRMLKKFVVLLPESCQIPELDGQFGTYTIVKEGSLNIKAGHADKRRSYEVPVYSIEQEDTVLYFLGESPTIMETLVKLSEFVPKFVNRLQVKRFRQTLMDFVNHKANAKFNDTVVFVDFNDEHTSHADELWKTISSHVDVRSAKVEQKDGTKDKSVCYAREYATSAVTLHELPHEFPKYSGLNILEMYKQSRKFAEFLGKVIGSEKFQTAIGDISKLCSIVYFDDEKMDKSEMTNELKTRLAQCIASGDFISSAL